VSGLSFTVPLIIVIVVGLACIGMIADDPTLGLPGEPVDQGDDDPCPAVIARSRGPPEPWDREPTSARRRSRPYPLTPS
jgi:hypothetical protein